MVYNIYLECITLFKALFESDLGYIIGIHIFYLNL